MIWKNILRQLSYFFTLDESSVHFKSAVFWPALIGLFFLFFTLKAYSIETETMPKNISTTSIEFDAPTLAKFNPQASTLVQTLNRFGLYNAGDLFNLGTLVESLIRE